MPSLPPELLTQWLQPGALVAGAVGGLGLLISAFRNLRADLKEEMRAGEARVNKSLDEVKEEMKAGEDRVNQRIGEVKEEMREVKEEMKAGEDRVNRRIDEVKEEMKELKALLIQALQLSPAPKP